MKKTIFMALVILASAAITAQAGDRKDKKKKKKAQTEMPACCQLANLNTQRDSLSYAAGMAATRGLVDYLEKSLGIDSVFMADFKQGFIEAVEKGTDPKYMAHTAGIQIAQQVQKQIFPQASQAFENTPDSLDMNLFFNGFLAGADNDTTHFASADVAAKYTSELKAEIEKRQSAPYIEANKKWLEDNKTKEGVVTLPSGLQYKILTKGTGAVADKSNNVTVKYEGKMIDGTEFDSSYKRNPDTSTFRPDQVIKGWTEALCLMPEGSKWELYIPQELAYGERQAGKIKPYSTLIFTVEVVKVEK